ncbi:MAG TPA: hypothetical protein VJ715_15675 [Pyrinomonadaceae bacterium]|nr:hypothetical protein [Pyrinomonadaceae bacterium]
MAVRTTTELQRIRYWQGQLLASGDLQTQLLVNEELRRLHNRALHQAHGVAIGLTLAHDETTGALTLDEETKKPTLSCGMAYDCAGRELIVGKDREIDRPPQLPMTLVIAYDPASVDGIALTWKRAQDVNANTEVAIAAVAQLTDQDNNPVKDVDNEDVAKLAPEFSPMVARPLARPRMATGKTIPGETPWQPWKVGETEVGVKVLIDTSAAGFTRVPHYFAEAVSGKLEPDFVPAWFASIADPSTQGFTLQLMLHRVTREALEILDPRAQVMVEPTLDQVVELSAPDLFVPNDFVARLLPLAEQASLITAISGSTATLDVALSGLSGTKEVAFGNGPRLAQVTKATQPDSFFEVTVEPTTEFSEGQIVVKLGANPESAHPAKIVFIDEEDTLALLPAITGLAADDRLGIAEQKSSVKSINNLEITVEDPDEFSPGDVVVRLGDTFETSSPAKIASKKADGTLVLATQIANLQVNDPLGIARDVAEVLSVDDNVGEVSIEVDDTKQFRKGDLVAKKSASGRFSAPVRVQFIASNKNALTLSGPIPDLSVDDIIAAADFRVRATVTKLDSATEPTVADATIFAPSKSEPVYVALIDDLLSTPTLPAEVKKAVGQTLTLAGQIKDLKPGSVIGRCAFPATVSVVAVGDSIEVSDADVLREGDVVTALPARSGLALVKKVTGKTIQLAGAIPGLAIDDELSVATIRGSVNVTSTATAEKVTVEKRPTHPRVRDFLRVDDFLAHITGWRQATPGVPGLAFVFNVQNEKISLMSPLNGLLLSDTVGLASLIPGLIRLRLKTMSVAPGDEVLLSGPDRLQGETQSLAAIVTQIIDSSTKLVSLLAQGSPGAFTFRPEDVTASVLFVKGSALALIQKHDLFVNWLAIGEPDQMPRPCDGADLLDDPCSRLEE